MDLHLINMQRPKIHFTLKQQKPCWMQVNNTWTSFLEFHTPLLL